MKISLRSTAGVGPADDIAEFVLDHHPSGRVTLRVFSVSAFGVTAGESSQDVASVCELGALPFETACRIVSSEVSMGSSVLA
jgi:hypothetical protein